MVVKWISLVSSIQNNIENNSLECLICGVNAADTACIPCGHKNFCYDCIDLCLKHIHTSRLPNSSIGYFISC